MKLILFVLLSIVFALVLAVSVGAFLPQMHVATASMTYDTTPQAVWQAITDYDGQAAWREELTAVQVERRPGGALRVREVDDNGASISYDIVEADPPHRLVRRIADSNLPFSGRWTFELDSEGGPTTLTITEHGEVYNPLFRFISRFVIGHTATMDHYLAALQEHLDGD